MNQSNIDQLVEGDRARPYRRSSMNESTAATVLLSGGIDSAACAHHLLLQGHSVEGIYVDHGQCARKCEIRAATDMASFLKIPLHIISVHGFQEMGIGEIIGRNSFLIFTALVAFQKRSNLLGIGIHSGPPYFDCSENFFSSIAQLVLEQTDGCVSLVAPFLSWSKVEVYRYFLASGLPIGQTYSCEAGTVPPCGECASCTDREAIRCLQNVES